MKAQGLLLVVVLAVMSGGTWAAAPNVIGTLPPANEGAVGVSDNITVTFHRAVMQGSVSNESFVVHGSHRGVYSGSFSWPDASQVVFDADTRFSRGEVITVTLTTEISSPTHEPMVRPYQFQFTVGAAASTGHFIWAGDFPLPNGPVSLCAADLDGDRDIDLAVAAISGQIAVMLNDGSAAFTLDSAYEASSQPYDVVAGDLDGDGDVDLVVALQSSDSVLVLANDGSGGFSELGHYPSGDRCQAVTLLDFNGDGLLDIATANYDADSVAVLANLGGGAFKRMWRFATTMSPVCVASGDFDSNHLIDLAAATKFGPKVEIWLNDDGTLQPDSSYTIDYQAWRMVTADLNGDRELDIVTVSWNDCISVLLNNGDGTFASHLTDSVQQYPRYLATGDIDGDGDQDIVISTHLSNELVVMTNDGNGSLTVDSAYGTSGAMQGIALADFNGDGILDAAAIDWNNNTLEIFTGTNTDQCCLARGDIDRSGGLVDISDLIWMVGWLFIGGQEPPCIDEADVNASGGIPDISDLVYLVDYMFMAGPPPVPCP